MSDPIVTTGIPVSPPGPGGKLCPICHQSSIKPPMDIPIVTLYNWCTGYVTGAVPLRREIRSLQKDFPDQWNLYLLGLKDFQDVDENEDLSYYQIAGKWHLSLWLPLQRGNELKFIFARDSRASFQGLEWRRGWWYHWVLHALLHLIPNMASSLPSFVWG